MFSALALSKFSMLVKAEIWVAFGPTLPSTTDEPAALPSPNQMRRVVVSSVANSWSASYALACASALKSVDLPALV